MRVLFTNHYLDCRAGSELCCLELCTALRRAGHEVAVFTFQRGGVAEELVRRGVPVFSVGDEALIERFDPEVLHVHHAPCLYYLGALRLRARVVFSSLGVLPALEAAPLVWAGVAHGLVVSEEVREVLRASPFGGAVPLSVFRNWFDDTGWTREAPTRPAEVRRIAVVTNHLDARLAGDLDALCAAHPGLEWTHFGLPYRSVELTPELLRGFDRVITIGRTALLAAALQKPCLLYDVHGCDGLLTAERLDAVATHNFSGRLSRARPSREDLERLLLDEAPRVDVAALAERVWREYALSRRVEELLALYTRLLGSDVRLGERTRSAYGREGRLYADLFLAWQDASSHLQGTRERLEAREADVALLKAAHEAERARGTQLQEQLGTLSTALDEKVVEAARLRSELDAIDSSIASAAVRRLRRVKDRIVATPGSRQRELLDGMLRRFKARRSRG